MIELCSTSAYQTRNRAWACLHWDRMGKDTQGERVWDCAVERRVCINAHEYMCMCTHTHTHTHTHTTHTHTTHTHTHTHTHAHTSGALRWHWCMIWLKVSLVTSPHPVGLARRRRSRESWYVHGYIHGKLACSQPHFHSSCPIRMYPIEQALQLAAHLWSDIT